MICRPRSPYLASHAFRYGWVRWQLMQPNVQKSYEDDGAAEVRHGQRSLPC